MQFPEIYRQRPDGFFSEEGQSGVFTVPARAAFGRTLRIIASDGTMPDCKVPWEHVSVSLHDYPNLCPGWMEMSLVKDLFWEEGDCVMQLHPPKPDHVDFSGEIGRQVLHLWRPTEAEIPMPPKICV